MNCLIFVIVPTIQTRIYVHGIFAITYNLYFIQCEHAATGELEAPLLGIIKTMTISIKKKYDNSPGPHAIHHLRTHVPRFLHSSAFVLNSIINKQING